MSSRLPFVTRDHVAALSCDPASAPGLPGRVYWDPEFHALERRHLFARTWVAAAVRSQVPAPGDVLPVDVAGWPLVFVHAADGRVRCFHNTCRHRAMAVVERAARGCRVLRCPWHGWTYELDGTLRGTPELGGVGVHTAPGFEPLELGLVEVRTAAWRDLLFVDLEGGAPPLDEHLAALDARLPRAYFDGFVHAESWTHVYPCNWKIAVEGAIEDYHLPWLHPEITDGAKRADASRVEFEAGRHYLVYSVAERFAEGRANAGSLPFNAAIEGDDARSVFFGSVFPTGIVGLSRDIAYLGTWLPDGPERTRLTFHYYLQGEGAARGPDAADARERAIGTLRRVFGQDDRVVAEVQARARVRDDIGIETRFSPYWETAVHDFQKHVIDTVMDGVSREHAG